MPVNLVNNVYGRLTVIERTGEKNRKHIWLCQCICGNQCIVAGVNLEKGLTRSCGCLRRELHMTHGYGNTPVYKCWWSMLDRCVNIKNTRFQDYGGRGIQVCSRWQSFDNFLDDMGHPPPGLTLDRIDNDYNYTPENCRWATKKQQSRNRRRTPMVDSNGASISLIEACQNLEINYPACFKHMLRHQITPQEALNHYKQKPNHGWRG